ncbi:hypothetical protein PHPALM_28020 [Phytophthora palmivora]|uniref:Uncharacterized protein n=1 Tax=Phytophthora palmivora TaxID=4796 RepID=A0A2P4XB42_9STRA|nr:hypothetical protein PHPALM_28020 [Phytophthora palmivora]
MKTRRQGSKAPLKETCQLDDTPDEDTLTSCWSQENEVNAVKPGRKSTRRNDARPGKKGLAKRKKAGNSARITASQESPPIFTFKTTTSSFRKRKKLKLEKQLEEEEKNKKRIQDLVAYFKNLDEQKLETA